MGRKKETLETVFEAKEDTGNIKLLMRCCENCFERMQIDNDFVCPRQVSDTNSWVDESRLCPFYRREPLAQVMNGNTPSYVRLYYTPQEKLALYVKYGCSVK